MRGIRIIHPCLKIPVFYLSFFCLCCWFFFHPSCYLHSCHVEVAVIEFFFSLFFLPLRSLYIAQQFCSLLSPKLFYQKLHLFSPIALGTEKKKEIKAKMNSPLSLSLTLPNLLECTVKILSVESGIGRRRQLAGCCTCLMVLRKASGKYGPDFFFTSCIVLLLEIRFPCPEIRCPERIWQPEVFIVY